MSWFHSARDERPVTTADHAAYGRGLVTFPGATLESPVQLERVVGSGFVSAGAESSIETTEAEVSRVVELVVDHATRHPGESLGVVGVTVAHAARLRDVLEHDRGARCRDGARRRRARPSRCAASSTSARPAGMQ